MSPLLPSFEEVMSTTRAVSGSPALEDDAALGLYEAALTVPPQGMVVEVGTQLGRSSSLLVQLAQARPFHLLHIDPYTSQTDMARQWLEMMARVARTFTLAHMRTDEAEWLLTRLAPFDLAYIDGDHNLPGVRIDLLLVASRIRSGGLLAAHDYNHENLPGVAEGLDEYVRSGLWDPLDLYGTLAVWRRK